MTTKLQKVVTLDHPKLIRLLVFWKKYYQTPKANNLINKEKANDNEP